MCRCLFQVFIKKVNNSNHMHGIKLRPDKKKLQGHREKLKTAEDRRRQRTGCVLRPNPFGAFEAP